MLGYAFVLQDTYLYAIERVDGKKWNKHWFIYIYICIHEYTLGYLTGILLDMRLLL
jgi:hypothetical protein